MYMWRLRDALNKMQRKKSTSASLFEWGDFGVFGVP